MKTFIAKSPSSISNKLPAAQVCAVATTDDLVVLGSVIDLTQGGPDGQWLDGNSGTNPKRFKK